MRCSSLPRSGHPLVHVPDHLQRRGLRNHVSAFGDDVGRREVEVLGPVGINGEEADVARAGLEGGESLARRVERMQLRLGSVWGKARRIPHNLQRIAGREPQFLDRQTPAFP
jgi:hypothetical protein